jgi:hypothetical protein
MTEEKRKRIKAGKKYNNAGKTEALTEEEIKERQDYLDELERNKFTNNNEFGM